MTLREAFGAIEGRKLAYVGDGNNVARSLAIARRARRASRSRSPRPTGYQLEDGLGAQLTDDPAEAVAGADAVYTDVWVSMSDAEEEAAARREALAPYRLDDALLDRAAPRRVRAALPARAPRRGDHRGRALRRRASGSGTRRRTAATRRRRCWSSSSARRRVAAMPSQQVVRHARSRSQGVHRAARPSATPRKRAADAAREQLQRFLDPREVRRASRASACRRRSTRRSSAGA